MVNNNTYPRVLSDTVTFPIKRSSFALYYPAVNRVKIFPGIEFSSVNELPSFFFFLFFFSSFFSVTISGARFKGFFLQARDPDTDSWIGSWAQTENTTTHPECSAVTHADPDSKLFATLIWNAPPNLRGRVYFT